MGLMTYDGDEIFCVVKITKASGERMSREVERIGSTTRVRDCARQEDMVDGVGVARWSDKEKTNREESKSLSRYI
jgi:hypothetical protein